MNDQHAHRHYAEGQRHTVFKTGLFQNHRTRDGHNGIGDEKSECHEVRAGVIQRECFFKEGDQCSVNPCDETHHKEKNADNEEGTQVTVLFLLI